MNEVEYIDIHLIHRDNGNVMYQSKFFGLAEAYILLEKYINDSRKIIFLNHLWEENILHSIREIEKFVNTIKEKRPQWKIFILINSVDEPYKDIINQINVDDILFIDFYLYATYREIMIYHRSAVRDPQSAPIQDKNKFLFLTGDPHKLHRIGLLKKFVNSNIMNQAEWSFHYNYGNKEGLSLKENYFRDLTDFEFQEFIKTWSKIPDESVTKNFSNRFRGFDYDVKLYNSTNFSVVSETCFRQPLIYPLYPWITEKTWIPILNRHPFLIAGDVGSLKALEERGFDVFRKFLKIKDYDSIIDSQERLNAIVENTNYFLTVLDMSDKNLKYAIDYNYERLCNLYMFNFDKILNFMYKHKLQNILSIDDIVPTYSRDYAIKNVSNLSFNIFYNNVKSDSWPDCETEEDFRNLPDEIKKECINKFGYVPSTKGQNDTS